MRRLWTSCPRATCGLLLAPRAVVACRRGCVVQSAGVDVVVSQIRRALIFIDYKMLPHITQTKVTRLDEAHLLNVTRSLV